MFRYQKLGFTLIEMIVVLAIMAIVSGTLIINFRVSATNVSARVQTANVVVGDIRKTQAMAISGTTYKDQLVCGFGIHYESEISYSIYARLIDPLVPCRADTRDRNFSLGDPIIETKTFQNQNMQILGTFPDVFFQLPDPLTFINNNSFAGGPPASIQIVVKKVLSPATEVTIYPSGKIDITDTVK